MELETRMCAGVEVRAEDKGIRMAGYAAVYNERARIGSEFEEEVAPGAFDRALSEGDDVVFLVNHRGLPLARTSSGTLKLESDGKGLRMDTELDSEDPDVLAIVPKVRRGDLSKMSFGFIATRQEWDFSGEMPRRIIREVQLRDVSLVTRPAYDGTSIALRSMQAHKPQVISQNMRRMRLMAAKLRVRA
jgi:HK97 family phage prohead protease